MLLRRAGKVMQRKRTEGEEREEPAESVDGLGSDKAEKKMLLKRGADMYSSRH